MTVATVIDLIGVVFFACVFAVAAGVVALGVFGKKGGE